LIKDQTKPKILVTEKVNPSILEELEAYFNVQVGERGYFDIEENWLTIDRDLSGILSMLSNPITEQVISHFSSLKIISNNAVGFNNIDVNAAAKHGVAVTNTPDILNNATADGTLALMLATVRNIPQSDQFIRFGKFDGWHPSNFCGLELKGAKLGIFGMGRIGIEVAKRASAFGMDIFYCNRKPVKESHPFKPTFVKDLKELAQEVDVLIALCPLSEATKHAINAEILDALGPSSYLINVSRGSVVQEEVLADYLLTNKIAGAGLDVFEFEPKIHPQLFKAKNCVLTPHIASATHETRNAMLRMCAKALKVALIDKKMSEIPHKVN
jgi:glyoxylate reductase